MTYFCSPARQRKNHRKLLPGEARFKRPSYPIVSVLGFDVGRVRGRRLDHGLQVRHLVLDGVDLLHLLGVVHDDHVGPGALQHVLHRFGRVGRINTGNDATENKWLIIFKKKLLREKDSFSYPAWIAASSETNHSGLLKASTLTVWCGSRPSLINTLAILCTRCWYSLWWGRGINGSNEQIDWPSIYYYYMSEERRENVGVRPNLQEFYR